jgi:hypothetical protein
MGAGAFLGLVFDVLCLRPSLRGAKNIVRYPRTTAASANPHESARRWYREPERRLAVENGEHARRGLGNHLNNFIERRL